MPEIPQSFPKARCSALEEFLQGNPGSSGLRCPSRMALSIGNQGDDHQLKPVHTTRQRGRRPRPHALQPPPRAGRKPGTSQYYGVRFRPDLNKWVAEIRVAEWKAVDKKVWLGTFETEQAAARGVDLARKLLKCRKKHRPNLPCPQLEAYGNTIPKHLSLTDLNAQSMFKEATSFIKNECKLYAASFNDSGSSSSQALGYNSSGVMDLDDCDSELLQDCGAAATNDALLEGFEVDSGFEVESYAMTPTFNHNHELGVSSSSSPSSCTSAGSCVTMGVFQGSEVAVPDFEVADCCGGSGPFQCCGDITGMVVMMPEVEEGTAMMKTTLAEQVDASAASQQWVEDENSLFPWPALFPQDSSTAFLMPDLTTPAGGYLAPGDLVDPWMFQGIHSVPFQNGWL